MRRQATLVIIYRSRRSFAARACAAVARVRLDVARVASRGGESRGAKPMKTMPPWPDLRDADINSTRLNTGRAVGLGS
jgi:hypothetical protein